MKLFKQISLHKVLILVSSVFIIASCEKVEMRDALENDNTAPGVVSDVVVESLPGGAIISYTLPIDNDVLYVMAEYEVRPGESYNVRSSYYNNSLTISGFGSTNEYKVDLYSVDRSGNRSEKKTVTVTPLTPPVKLAYENLTYESTFGGIHVVYQNDAKADLVTNIIIKNADNEWIEYDKHYSNLPKGDFSVRGLPSTLTSFGVFFHDRWGNKSDTLIKELTPFFETELSSEKFTEVKLPGDATNQWSLPLIWDGNPTNNGGFSARDAFPKHFQFSLGVKSKLSRFKLWGVNNLDRMYTAGNLKEFELWGSNSPNPDGSFESWELMGVYTVIKPSGLPVGDFTSVDKETALAGLDFEVPLNAPAVKYLRINILSTFASPRNVPLGDAWIRELKFWGEERP